MLKEGSDVIKAIKESQWLNLQGHPTLKTKGSHFGWSNESWVSPQNLPMCPWSGPHIPLEPHLWGIFQYSDSSTPVHHTQRFLFSGSSNPSSSQLSAFLTINANFLLPALAPPTSHENLFSFSIQIASLKSLWPFPNLNYPISRIFIQPIIPEYPLCIRHYLGTGGKSFLFLVVPRFLSHPFHTLWLLGLSIYVVFLSSHQEMLRKCRNCVWRICTFGTQWCSIF